MRSLFAVALVFCVVLMGCGGAKNKNPKEFDIDFRGGTSDYAMQSVIKNVKSKERSRTWKRSRLIPNASRLRVGDKAELPIKGLQASVQIDGFQARVTLDCFFYNDRSTILEGNFQLRLPNNASLYFFAFGQSAFQLQRQAVPEEAFFTSVSRGGLRGAEPQQILARRESRWRKPKVARVVPRDKAAFAYRETVRRRVDPALAEWSGADVFSARVFPLAPKTLHHIVIGYDVPLVSVDDVFQYQLDLPSVPNCIVELDIARLSTGQPVLIPPSKPTRQGSRLIYRYDNPAKRVITAQIANQGNIVLTGGDEKSGSYFVTRFRPKLPEIAKPQGSGAAVFLVDVSLSSQPDRFNVWLKLLRSILEKNRDSIQEFAVLFFNIESFWWQPSYVPNTAQNTDELLRFANKLTLEGGTNLHRALKEGTQPRWRPHAASQGRRPPIFLLSDGAATWGENSLYAMSDLLTAGERTPLYAYTTGMSGTDTRALNHLARESGGALFAVVNEDQIDHAAMAHRRQSWQLKSVKSRGSTDLLLAGRPNSLFPGQELTLVGRRKPPKVIELELSNGREQRKISVTITHRIDSKLASRAYGSIAVGQLESIPEIEEKVAAAYARHFRVPGKTCSLLMLESESDYRRYKILPKEDAYVVSWRPASDLVRTALARFGKQIGDRRAALLAWLKRLERSPGVNWAIPASLELAIKQMPKSSFEVKSQHFACKQRKLADLPSGVMEDLIATRFRYQDVYREADRRFKKDGAADALRALSSLVESRPGDSVLARDVGFSAMTWGLGGEAYPLFRRVAKARPSEPHNYHAMARCLTDMKHVDLAIVWYEVALGGKWSSRFGPFRQIALIEYVNLLRQIAEGKFESSVHAFALARLETLSKQLLVQSADVLVTIMWNTDGTDVDLYVTDPRGETCSYNNRRTRIGGKMTQDVTQGFGPEMFYLPRAKRGRYGIRVNYFASDALRTSARTKVYATIYRGWESVTRRVVTLAGNKENQHIAQVRVK